MYLKFNCAIGVTAIDHTGVEAVLEVRKTLENKGIKVIN